MEEIFANPGYKIIVHKILNYLDANSIVNLTKVSKTICFNMKSVKTCQIYFNKCMEILPQTTRFQISKVPKAIHLEIKTKTQNDLEVYELMQVFQQLTYLAQDAQMKQAQQFSNQTMMQMMVHPGMDVGMLLDPMRFCSLGGLMGFYGVLWGPMRSYGVLYVCCEVLLGSIWVLLGPIGSYWVFLGPIGSFCFVLCGQVYFYICSYRPDESCSNHSWKD